MRKPALTAAVLAAGLLVLSACSSGGVTSNCTLNQCDVTVTTTSSVSTKMFKKKFKVKFSALKDDSITISEGSRSKTLKEGQTDTVGRIRVEVKDADAGEAKLLITPA